MDLPQKRRKVLIAVGVGVALVAVALVARWMLTGETAKPEPPRTQAVAQVSITEDGFVPATLKVKTGTAVVWTNVDGAPHRVAANPYPTHSDLPGLDSKVNIDSNDTYRFTFDKPGIYKYHDETYPQSNGTIVVE